MNFKAFFKSDSGAVTVDWVVLTSAMVGLGFVTAAIVTTGVEDLSYGISNELTLQAEFTSASVGVDWGSYANLANQHGASWGTDAEGRNWAESTYAGWSDPNILSDAALQTQYAANYAYATTQPAHSQATRTYADYAAVQEQIMIDRGLEIPAGNQSAAEVRARFESSSSSL